MWGYYQASLQLTRPSLPNTGNSHRCGAGLSSFVPVFAHALARRNDFGMCLVRPLFDRIKTIRSPHQGVFSIRQMTCLSLSD